MTHPDRTAPMDAQTAVEQLAALSLTTETLDSVLQTVVDLVKRITPGPVEASVSILIADRPTTFVYSGQLALDLDESQYGRGYGPCLHAASRGETVEVADARRETRWADYMREAARLGVLSSLSVPLGSAEQLAAGLNVYAREPDVFDDGTRAAVAKLAHFAGVSVANVRAYRTTLDVAENLRVALESRAIIDQAKGILVERHGLTPDQAFQVLAHASMGTNRRLRDVADHLVRTGQLLTPP
jgi:GAF domain-containing protein